jgi:hypothetical protein
MLAGFLRANKSPDGCRQRGLNCNEDVSMKPKSNSNTSRAVSQGPVYDQSAGTAVNFRKKLGWLITESPDAVRMTITPEMAEVMLERNVSEEWKNRPKSQTALERYTKKMKSGGWFYTGQTIIFSSDGKLINGQHTLTACVRSGATIDHLVAFGVDEQAFKYIDTGTARTPGHMFAIEDIPNYNVSAAACRILYLYDQDKNWSGSTSGQVESDDLLVFYFANESIQRSISYGKRIGAEKFLPQRWGAFCHYICARKESADADAFFERVICGIGIDSSRSPEYVLRKKLIEISQQPTGKKLPAEALAAFVIISWNAKRQGVREKTFLRWSPDKSGALKFPRAL